MNKLICAVIVVVIIANLYYWCASSQAASAMPAVATTVTSTSGTTPAVVVPAAAAVSPAASTVQSMTVGRMFTLPFEKMDPVSAIVGGRNAVMVPMSSSTMGGHKSYNYVGCFADTGNKALKTQVPGYLTVQQCYAAAKNAGAAYFALQQPAVDGSGTAQCYIGQSGYDRYGSSQQCSRTDGGGNMVGAQHANSVYSTA